MQKKLILAAMLALGLAACSTVPRGHLNEAVRTAPQNDIQLAEVKSDIDVYMDTLVRWGGEVMRSEPIKTDQGLDLIRVEVLQRDLDSKARPKESENSDGRFVAYIPQPEKKLSSLKGHLITVVGAISNAEQMQLNENSSVTLPVLESKDFYVWHQYDDDRDSNLHFRLIFGHPHLWLDYGHHYRRFYHHRHAHGPYYRKH